MGANAESEVKAVAAVKPVKSVTSFKVAKAVDAVVKLRDEATGYWQQFEVGGRDALYSLLGRVYGIYVNTMTAEKEKQLDEQLRVKLKEAGKEATKGAKLSNMLVRYVFADPSDKQVSQWATVLRRMWADKVEVADFVAVVEKTDGGLSGFRDPKKPVAAPKFTPAIALSKLENAETIGTLDIDWDGDEESRLFLAVPGDGGDAELKALPVSSKLLDTLLVGYLKEADAAEAAAKVKSVNVDDEVLLLDREDEVLKAKKALVLAKKALADAKAKEDKGDHEALANAVDKAKASLEVAKEVLKADKKRLKH